MTDEKLSTNFQENARQQGNSFQRLTKQVAKGAMIIFIGSVLGKGFNFLTQIVLSKLFGAELLGLYAIGLGIIYIAYTIAKLGLAQGALRYVSIYYGVNNKERVKGTIILSIVYPLITGITISAALFVNAGYLAHFFGKPDLDDMIKIFSPGIPFMAAMMVALEAIKGFKKMEYFIYIKNIFHPSANLVIIVLGYWLGYHIYGAVSAWVIASILGFTLTVYFIKKQLPGFNKINISLNTLELVKFSSPLLLVDVIQMLLIRVDIFMLGYFQPSARVGIYNAATQLVLLLTIFSTALNYIFAPLAADLYHKKNTGNLASLLKVSAKWTFFATFPMFILIITYAKSLLSIFGTEFSDGWLALWLLAVCYFVSIAMGPVTELLVMSGKQVYEFFNTTGCFIINIILNYLLIPRFGIAGAALATGISIMIMHLARLMEIRCLLFFWPFSNKYIKGLIAGFVSLLICHLVKPFIMITFNSYSNYILTLLLIGIFIMVYLAGLFLNFDDEDKEILQAVKKKIWGN